jgi:hypothetical protein
LENIKKATIDSLRNDLKRNNRVEEGGASSLGVKTKHESTNLRA